MHPRKSSRNTSFRRPLTLRERNLLAITLWVLALLGAVALFKQYVAASHQLTLTRATIEGQQHVLDSKDDTATRLDAHLHRIEAAQVATPSEFQTLIETTAREIRLVPDSVPAPKTETKNGVQILTLHLVFRNATMDRLLLFEDRLRNAKIPLSVTNTLIDAGRDAALNATFDIATYRLDPKGAKDAPKPRRTTRAATRANNFANNR